MIRHFLDCRFIVLTKVGFVIFASCAVPSSNRESTGAGNFEDEIDRVCHDTTNTGATTSTTQIGKGA
jgi:hypothetical protein